MAPAWRDGGTEALRSKGPVSREQLSPQQRTRLELERREENAATQVPLCADELADLNELAARTGVQGNRYNEQHMPLVGR